MGKKALGTGIFCAIGAFLTWFATFASFDVANANSGDVLGVLNSGSGGFVAVSVTVDSQNDLVVLSQAGHDQCDGSGCRWTWDTGSGDTSVVIYSAYVPRNSAVDFSGAVFNVQWSGTLDLTQTGMLSFSGANLNTTVNLTSTGRTVDEFLSETANSKYAGVFLVWLLTVILTYLVFPVSAFVIGFKYGSTFFRNSKNG